MRRKRVDVTVSNKSESNNQGPSFHVDVSGAPSTGDYYVSSETGERLVSSSESDTSSSELEPGSEDLDSEVSIKFEDKAAVSKKHSKHAKARLQEVPKFQESQQPTKRNKSGGTLDHGDPNHGWPQATHYTPHEHYGHVISLTKQPPPLKCVIQSAINRVVADVLFETAYPSIKSQNEDLRSILLECAKAEKEQEIARRIKHC
ncbi:hypothetical protein BJ165DRAFT_1531821 [Panaeolus papilionaceus]|nr:hypothetical protein BJ165DRAFT_1531821 [Panaeolus papilionaceus]